MKNKFDARTIILLSAISMILIISSCTSPSRGVPLDPAVTSPFCPEDGLSPNAICSQSTVYTLNEPSPGINRDFTCVCGNLHMATYFSCLMNNNQSYTGDDRALCKAQAIPYGLEEKCCDLPGSSGFIREVFKDCLPGKDVMAGRDPPQCWVPVTNRECKGFSKVGSTGECSVIDYYGICFQKCGFSGDACMPEKNQCCKKGCASGAIATWQQTDLACVPNDPSHPSYGGKCGVCPSGQIPCGDTCYIPSSTLSCCGPDVNGVLYNPQTEGCCGTGFAATKYSIATESCCGIGPTALKYTVMTDPPNCCINNVLTRDCGADSECCSLQGTEGIYNGCREKEGECQISSSPSNYIPDTDPCIEFTSSSLCNNVVMSYCLPKVDGIIAAKQCASHYNNPAACIETGICEIKETRCEWQWFKCGIRP